MVMKTLDMAEIERERLSQRDTIFFLSERFFLAFDVAKIKTNKSKGELSLNDLP